MYKKILYVIPLLAVGIFLAACGGALSKGQALENQQQQQASTSLELNQPLPHFNYSQIRQNLIELETAQANGVQTTSFFFNMGVANPVQTCPSIGAPIPITDELSNPDQVLKDNTDLNNGGGNVVIGQQDPNGVYTGQGTGTYVMCIGANGKPYADYWEGFVQTVFGPAKWNSTTHSIQLIGPPSFSFSKNKAQANKKP